MFARPSAQASTGEPAGLDPVSSREVGEAPSDVPPVTGQEFLARGAFFTLPEAWISEAPETTVFLMDEGADPDATIEWWPGHRVAPLHLASSDGRTEIVELFAHRGAVVSTRAGSGDEGIRQIRATVGRSRSGRF